jgi:NIPSNAP
MPIYEKRTYSVTVGQMAEVTRLYISEGFPAMQAGGFDQKLVGYFVSDTGELHQLVHLWKFDDDADRRSHWQRLGVYPPFGAFVKQLRPLLLKQDVQLLTAAPWGPHP